MTDRPKFLTVEPCDRTGNHSACHDPNIAGSDWSKIYHTRCFEGGIWRDCYKLRLLPYGFVYGEDPKHLSLAQLIIKYRAPGSKIGSVIYDRGTTTMIDGNNTITVVGSNTNQMGNYYTQMGNNNTIIQIGNNNNGISMTSNNGQISNNVTQYGNNNNINHTGITFNQTRPPPNSFASVNPAIPTVNQPSHTQSATPGTWLHRAGRMGQQINFKYNNKHPANQMPTYHSDTGRGPTLRGGSVLWACRQITKGIQSSTESPDEQPTLFDSPPGNAISSPERATQEISGDQSNFDESKGFVANLADDIDFLDNSEPNHQPQGQAKIAEQAAVAAPSDPKTGTGLPNSFLATVDPQLLSPDQVNVAADAEFEAWLSFAPSIM